MRSIEALFLVAALFHTTVVVRSFHLLSTYHAVTQSRRMKTSLTMRWHFSKGVGRMEDLGLVGSEGELYFHPSKEATIVHPPTVSASFGEKEVVIPILPHNNVLAPLATDWLNVFEMKHRQLTNDVGYGCFGFTHYSQSNQKLALVGTIARIKDRKILNDGRSFMVVEGIRRLFIKEFLSESPYMIAKVKLINDWTECRADVVDTMERKIFSLVKRNVKMMEILFPEKNYSINQHILDHRPSIPQPGVRSISTNEAADELKRRSDFSFAVMDTLQITPAAKLALMQEHVIERRLEKILDTLENGSVYLKTQLVKKGLLSEDALLDLLTDMQQEPHNMDNLVPKSLWTPENYEGGAWVQKPIMM